NLQAYFGPIFLHRLHSSLFRLITVKLCRFVHEDKYKFSPFSLNVKAPSRRMSLHSCLQMSFEDSMLSVIPKLTPRLHTFFALFDTHFAFVLS
ncbi:Hypothetical predicted protein, partial [Xyrichtys novacula]